MPRGDRPPSTGPLSTPVSRRAVLAAGASLLGLAAAPAARAELASLDASAPMRWAWSVELDDGALRGMEGDARSLSLARGLGVQLVRLDVSWDHVQPAEDAWLPDRLAWYARLVQAATDAGLGVIANLDDYPRWALETLARRPDRFFAAWSAYVGQVARVLGSGVTYWQLGNEFNSVLDPIPPEHDPGVVTTGRAALEAALGPQGRRPTTVVNPFYGFGGVGSEWEPALRRMLDDAAGSIDVIALDYYPGSYNPLGDPTDWTPLEDLALLADAYGQHLAVGETGCPSFWGTARQAQWVARALPALARKVEDLGFTDRMAYVNLFELVDREELQLWELWRPTEVTLGLADHAFRPKPAYDVLRALIGRSSPPRVLAQARG